MNFVEVYILIVLVSFSKCEAGSGDGHDCPKHIFSIADGCYVTKENILIELNYAASYCSYQNASAAKPSNQNINNAIKEQLLTKNNERNKDEMYTYTLGITRTKGQPFFHFKDSNARLLYTDWDPAVPDLDKNCVAYVCNNGKYFWRPLSCESNAVPLCKINDCPAGCFHETTPALPTTTAPLFTTFTSMSSSTLSTDEMYPTNELEGTTQVSISHSKNGLQSSGVTGQVMSMVLALAIFTVVT